MLDSSSYGFKIKADGESYTLSHLMYIDDIKLYAGSKQALEHLIQITSRFSKDIKMNFGLEKCKTVQIVKGKLRTENIGTANDNEIITALSQGDTYKYLGVQQARQTEHVILKKK